MQNRKATSNDYDVILKLWETSVLASHNFLSSEDFQEMKNKIPSYLPHPDVRLWYMEDLIIGFSSIRDNHLEMLFLDPKEVGQGYGKEIIQVLINEFGVKTVDVYKDNKNAKLFYLKNGFLIVREELTDGFGRPYPVLHLKLK